MGAIKEVGIPCQELGTAVPGEQVLKYGATTGLSFGTVESVGAIRLIEYQQPCGTPQLLLFTDQIIIRGNAGAPFSAGGDSGSLVLTVDLHPIGLLFAGNKASSVANHISNVVSSFAAIGTMDFVGQSCGPDSTKPELTIVLPLVDFLKINFAEILQIPGVVGLGAGIDERTQSAVVNVYVQTENDVVFVPPEIYGWPTRAIVSGAIRAL